MLCFLPVAFLTSVLLFVLVYSLEQIEKERTRHFQKFAEQLGFEFLPKVESVTFCIDDSELFRKGNERRIFNLIQGVVSRLNVAIFDYEYSWGTGKGKTPIRQTVLRFSLHSVALPEFNLQPKTWLEGLIPRLGVQGIDFSSYPLFSTRYAVSGEDVQTIRCIFGEEVIKFYEKHNGLSTELGKGYILFYFPEQRTSPSNISDFLEIGLNALNLFLDFASKPIL